MHALIFPLLAAVSQPLPAPEPLRKFAVDIGEAIEIAPGTEVVPLEIIEDRRCYRPNECDFSGALKVRLKVTEPGKTEELTISPTQRFRIGGGWLFFAGTFGMHGLEILQRDHDPYLLAFTYDPKAMPEPDIQIFSEGPASPAQTD